MTVDKVEVQLAGIRSALEAHTSQDMTQFDSLFTKLEALDGKLDALLIREARKEGEFSGIKKTAVVLAAFISFAVSVGAAIVPNFIR